MAAVVVGVCVCVCAVCISLCIGVRHERDGNDVRVCSNVWYEPAQIILMRKLLSICVAFACMRIQLHWDAATLWNNTAFLLLRQFQVNIAAVPSLMILLGLSSNRCLQNCERRKKQTQDDWITCDSRQIIHFLIYYRHALYATNSECVWVCACVRISTQTHGWHTSGCMCTHMIYMCGAWNACALIKLNGGWKYQHRRKIFV